MSAPPREILLHLTPHARFDLIDVVKSVHAQHGDIFTPYRPTVSPLLTPVTSLDLLYLLF